MTQGDVTACRACGSTAIDQIVDLGETPVANRLVDPRAAGPEPDRTYPLNLCFCHDCALVQLGYALPADEIFDEDYPYFTSYSDTLSGHAQRHVRGLLESGALTSGSLVVEVASNDGYLLRHFAGSGVRVLGVDPAPGPAEAAEAVGVPTLVGFFGVDRARQIRDEYGPADVIIANNVMAHVPDLHDVVGGLAELLADDGVITVENPWVHSMVDHVEFDTIYHEHYCYFSCSSIDALFRLHGLRVNDVEYFPDIHGGSLRWHIGRQDRRTARCVEYFEREAAGGVTSIDHYLDFARRVRACQHALVETLTTLRDEGRTVAGYGAAAKGATLLNTSGVGSDLMPYVVDRNVHKQGMLIPGCRIPIRPTEALLEDMPDDVILLAWNYATEIAEQQVDYLRNGGRLWSPVPTAHVIDSGRPPHDS